MADMTKNNIGSTFDDFLLNEKITSEVEAIATKRVLACLTLLMLA